MTINPKKIIIRMPNWLGDAVMATPIIDEIRQKFPSASITIMAKENIAGLFEKDLRVNELFYFSLPKGSIFMRRKEGRNIIEALKRGKYDVGLLLTNSFSSAWWFFRAGIKTRVGFASDLRSCLLNEVVKFPKNRTSQHLVDTYKTLLKPFGIFSSKSMPKLFISQDEIKTAKEMIKRLGYKEGMKIIGINTQAAFGPAKCWPEERFLELTEMLNENSNLFLLFFGDVKCHASIENITCKFSSRVCNLAGLTSLRELMALISLLDLFITNDSGPMHIAAALNTPLIALFGSTSDIVTGPYKKGLVIHKHVECSPCFKRVCPIDFRCMKRIAAVEVYDEAMRLLKVKCV
jgi:heptosyltransferase-2